MINRLIVNASKLFVEHAVQECIKMRTLNANSAAKAVQIQILQHSTFRICMIRVCKASGTALKLQLLHVLNLWLLQTAANPHRTDRQY